MIQQLSLPLASQLNPLTFKRREHNMKEKIAMALPHRAAKPW